MADQFPVDFTIGLSEEEKRDLERMIGDFQKKRTERADDTTPNTIQKQIADINSRLAYLTNMFLIVDRRMQPLYETIRLTFQKSELLNQRINTILDSLRSRESL